MTSPESKVEARDARAARHIWLRERLIADSCVVLALVGWWLMARHLPPYLFPDILTVLKAMMRLVTDPSFVVHTATSVGRIFLSVALSLLIGGVLAMIPRYVPAMHEFIHDRVKPVLNSFPSVGWALLGSIWFGVSSFAVLFIQIAILIPFTFINISEGLREINPEQQEMARSFSRASRRVFALVLFPMLYPYLIAALRISYGVAWKVSLVSELFGAERGLGYLLMNAQTDAHVDMVFAICLIIVVFYVLGEKLIVDSLSRFYQGDARSA